MDQLKLGQGMPKICIPMIGRTKTEILQFAGQLRDSVADLVEWRADYFEQLQDMAALQQMCAALADALGEKPILFTIRTSAEGGEAALSFAEYAAILRAAAAWSAVSYIDVEMYSGSRESDAAWQEIESACHENVRNLVRDLKEQVCVIGSYHDFAKTPTKEEIRARLCGSYHLGADIPKLAVMPHSKEDVMALMGATMQAKEELGAVPLITMSMGDLGKISRIAGESFGSALTFGCIGRPSAPGQMEANELKQVLQLLHVEG